MSNREQDSQSIESILERFIREQFLYERPDEALTPNQHLIEEGIVDSVGILQLVGFIERTFGITVRPEDLVLDNFQSLNSMAALIRRNQ